MDVVGAIDSGKYSQVDFDARIDADFGVHSGRCELLGLPRFPGALDAFRS